MRRNPFSMRLPAECFEELEPRIDEDGNRIRRVRIKGTNAIGEEVKPKLIHCELLEVKPMSMPTGPLFFLDFEMPK